MSKKRKILILIAVVSTLIVITIIAAMLILSSKDKKDENDNDDVEYIIDTPISYFVPSYPQAVISYPSNSNNAELQEMIAATHQLNSAIADDYNFIELDECETKITNDNFSEFALTYDSCTWRVSATTITDKKPEYYVKKTQTYLNFSEISSKYNVKFEFWIPGIIGFSGPSICFLPEDEIKQINDNIFRINRKNDTAHIYTALLYFKGSSEFNNITSGANQYDVIKDGQVIQNPDPENLSACYNPGPGLNTNLTIKEGNLAYYNIPYFTERQAGIKLSTHIEINLEENQKSDRIYIESIDNLISSLEL